MANHSKKVLFDHIRENVAELSLDSDETLEKIIFKSSSAKILTYEGVLVFNKLFKSYSFPYTDLNTGDILKLITRTKMPFYIAKKDVILFSDSDALMIHLYGDIENWLNHLH